MVNNLVNSVVGSIYIGADKRTILSQENITSYQPLSNNNVLFVYLENAFGNSGVVTASFKSGTQRIPTTQPFFLRFIKDVSKVVGGEVTPRHFSKYILTIPQPVANLNLNKTEPLNIHTTINVSSSIKFIGTFNTLVDLTAHVGSVEKDIAYVIESGIYGYYEYVLDNGSLKWLRIENDDISRKVIFSQYGFFDIGIQGGYFSEVPHTNINDWQEYVIWQEINQTNYRLAIAETDIDDLEVDLGETKNRVEQNETNIENLKNRVSENENSIDIIENDILEIKSDINELDGRLTTAETDIQNLENDKVDKTVYNADKITQDNRDVAQETRLNTVELNIANLENQNLLHSPTFNGTNGHLTFQRYGASPIVIDLPTEMIVTSGVYDDINNELVLNLASGGEVRIPVGNLLTDLDAENIRYNGAGTYYLSGKNRVEQAINELDLQVKAVNDNKLDASVYNNDIPLIDAELLRLEDDKANKSELVASDVATSEVGVSVQDAIDDVEARVENVETEVKNNTEINREQDYRIATIEEAYRKSQSGEITATKSGTDIISLGKDVAPAPLQVKVDGGLLEAKQLVTNKGNPFANATNYSVYSKTTLSIENGKLRVTSNGNPTATFGFIYALNTTAGKYYIKPKLTSPTLTQSIIYLWSDASNNENASFIYSNNSVILTSLGSRTSLRIVNFNVETNVYLELEHLYVFNIDNLIANKTYSPLYNKTFDLMLDAEIKAQMDLWVQNGTLPNDNVLAVGMNKRVRSVGRNLFSGNGGLSLPHSDAGVTFTLEDGTYSVIGTATGYPYRRVMRFPAYSLKPGTYSIKKEAISGFQLAGIRVVDRVSSPILIYNSGANPTGTFTITDNSKPIDVETTTGIGVSYNEKFKIQIELGSTETSYGPYANSDLYLQANKVGYKLPNGVVDTIEYRNGKYYFVQRVQKYVLQASDITLFNVLTNVLQITLSSSNLTGKRTWTNDVFGDIRILNFIERRFGVDSGYGIDDVWSIGKMATTATQLIVLYYELGTYASLAEAQSALAGTVVYYQLATPIETEILALGNAQGLAGGTVYIDDIMADSNIYTSKYDIENVNYPIKSLDRIVKINADGSQTELAVSSATIAGDGLSFTHPSLVANDIVWIAYAYNVANLFKSNTFVTYYDNPFIAVQPNGTPRRIVFAVDDSGVVIVSSQAV